MDPVTAPAATTAPSSTAAPRLRIGVVGLGAISQSVHLPLLARCWDLFEIAAIADLSASRAGDVAGRYGVGARFTSLDDLLEAHRSGACPLDGVLVATSGTHGPEVLAVVEAGLPVLCEKPLALSEAEIDAIESVEGARVLLGYMKEYDPATAHARAELDGKRLRAVTVEVLHPSSPAQLEFARLLPPSGDIDADRLGVLIGRTETSLDAAVGTALEENWRNIYANVVLGSIVHDISLLRHLVGGIETVESATGWADSADGPGSLEAIGTVAGGARLHLAWHYLPQYPDYRETVTFHHDTGSVSLVFGIPYLLNGATELRVVARSGDGGEVRTEYRWKQQEAFENELVAFHALVTAGAAPHSSTGEGRVDLVVAQTILGRLGERHGLPTGGEVQLRSVPVVGQGQLPT